MPPATTARTGRTRTTPGLPLGPLAVLGLLVLSARGAHADPAHIAGVRLTRRPYASWQAVVHLEHEDVDRRHFCDEVEVLDQDGQRVFFGHFYAPKVKDVEEDGPIQRRIRPFPLSDQVLKLRFRAHCKLTGWGGKELEVDLARKSGPGWRIDSTRYKYLPHFEGIETSDKLRTWRKRLLALPPRYPYPPRGPIPRTPPEPVDTRPQAKDRQRYVNWPAEAAAGL